MVRLAFDVGTADIEDLVIAGWTGRDVAALNHHIEELKAIGVQPPSSVPLYYRAAAALLTQADTIQVLGDDSSGEVEPVLIGTPERLWVTIGADHTDRKVESYNIAVSKQVCQKPVGRTAWRFEDIEPHWDQLILRSYVTEAGKKVLYQEGPLANIRPPRELVAGWRDGDKRLRPAWRCSAARWAPSAASDPRRASTWSSRTRCWAASSRMATTCKACPSF